MVCYNERYGIVVTTILAQYETNGAEYEGARFVTIYSGDTYDIVYNAQTEVMCAVSNAGVFTGLVDQTDSPMLYKPK